jgi:WD40 repeat protein
VRQLLFSADGSWLALGGDFDSVLVFEVATGDLVVGLQGHGTGLSELAFSPDKRLLATGLGGSGVFLWDLSSLVGQAASTSTDQVQIPRATLGEKVPGLSLSAMIWANNGSYLALADRFGKVYVLRAQP